MASPQLQAFLASMSAGGSREALASYNEGAFAQLDEAEAELATEACVAKILSGQNDPRAVQVLDRFFRMETEPRLREAMTRMPGNETKAAILKFLLELRRRNADFEALVALSTEGTRGGRLDAIHHLGAYDRRAEDVHRALMQAVRDPDEDVRFQAMLLGFKRLELLEVESTPPSPHSSVGRLLLSPLKSVQAEGARIFGEVVAAAEAGEDAGTFSFPAAYQAPLDAVFDSLDARGAPLAPLDAFEGRARDWVEELLLAKAHEDPRLVHALGAMDTARARATLVELEGGQGPCAEAAAVVLGAAREAAADAALATHASEAASLTVDRAAALGTTLAEAAPDRVFDAAVSLAVAEDPVRRAFADAALAAAPQWGEAHRADLLASLSLEDPATA
jgi:hypothetical protein